MTSRPGSRSLRAPSVRLIVVAGFLVSLALPAAARADALLIESTPADGTVVIEALTEVEMLFSQPLAEGSRSVLLAPDGEVAEEGVISTTNPAVMTIAVPADATAGEYEVRWTTVPADGHAVNGTFTFSYAPPPPATPSPTPEPTPEPTASPSPASPSPEPSASPTAEPTPDPDSAADTTDSTVVIALLVGLLIVGGVVAFALWRRGASSRTGPTGTSGSAGSDTAA